MNLSQTMIEHGRGFFRLRSYLPLLMVVVVATGLANFTFPFQRLWADEVWDLTCVLIAMTGLAVRVATVGFVPRGTSGRNTRKLKAPALNMTGMYSVVRHPLYVGNFLIFLGFALFFHEPLLAIVAVLVYWLYYERIMLAEEAFLRDRFGEEFDAWAARTPAIFPRWSNWMRPALPFSWRSALRREYTTLFLIAAVLSVFEVLGHAVVQHKWQVQTDWLVFFAAASGQYTAIWIIKHTTDWLVVEDR